MLRILITGGAGFVGSNIADHIISNNPKAQVIVYDDLSRRGVERNIGWLKEFHGKSGRLKIVKGDVRDLERLRKTANDVSEIYHTAAQVAVTTSLVDPFTDFEVNARGTFNVLEAARHSESDPAILYCSCYDEKTRAVTKRGLKRYSELEIGDIVLSINPDTGKIEEKAIKDIIVQPYSGSMVHFRGKRVDLCVTPNHRMLIQRGSKLFFDRADNVMKKANFRWKLPMGRWKGLNHERIPIQQSDLPWNAKRMNRFISICDLFYLIGLYIGDGYCQHQIREKPTKTGLNREEYLSKCKDPKTRRFVHIMRDGGITKCASHVIFYYIPENDPCRSKLEKVLSRNGVQHHSGRSKTSGGWGVYFSSIPLFRIFEECGANALEKRIPPWILEYDEKYLKHLFAGLIDSDGCWRENPSFTTSSVNLVRDVIELGVKIGYSVYVYKDRTETKIEDRTIEGKCYRLTFSPTLKGLPSRHKKIIPYRGIIWCVKVEDNENLLVERNGKIAFSGNTNKVYGNLLGVKVEEHPTRYDFADPHKSGISENQPLDPCTPYGCSKAAGDIYTLDYAKTYGLKTVVFRMSCVYGTHQYGNEDQGWVAHFVISTIFDRLITIYGDGKQVRDILYISDLVNALQQAVKNISKTRGQAYNVGGGPDTTLSLLELIKFLEETTGKKVNYTFAPWRPADQKVYYTNITKAKMDFGWKPKVNKEEGIQRLCSWVSENRKLFENL